MDKKICVFDIEVVPYDFEVHFDEPTKEYLLKYVKTDEDKKNTIENLVFSPFASMVVAIGMYNYFEDKGGVLVYNPDIEKDFSEEVNGNIFFYYKSEYDLIENFWIRMERKKYDLFITFNGREFDCPFLMLRSMILGISPKIDLMKGSDFNFREYHIDLLKEMTFGRAERVGARRRFSLDFYCRQLGIGSPKSEYSGVIVKELFEGKKYKEIATYCLGDVIATKKLFDIWNKYIGKIKIQNI
ncbi:MAG: 3'-5' exonuclease [Ignavibacteria bacterium]|nr:3'-5' exonuclease [Ignavibacteria bacterium]